MATIERDADNWRIWALAACGAVIMAGGSFWVNHVAISINEVKTDVRDLRIVVDNQARETQKTRESDLAQRYDRIAALEIKQATLDQRMTDVSAKLDKVIDILEKRDAAPLIPKGLH